MAVIAVMKNNEKEHDDVTKVREEEGRTQSYGSRREGFSEEVTLHRVPSDDSEQAAPSWMAIPCPEEDQG